MGTSFACTQCHSHPYDPFHHEDYYRFMAYFNDTRDEDSYADYPLLRHSFALPSLNHRLRVDAVLCGRGLPAAKPTLQMDHEQ